MYYTPSSLKKTGLQNNDNGCFPLMDRIAATVIWNIPSTSNSSCALDSSKQRDITGQNKRVILSDIKIQNSFGTAITSTVKEGCNCFILFCDYCSILKVQLIKHQPITFIEADVQEDPFDDGNCMVLY